MSGLMAGWYLSRKRQRIRGSGAGSSARQLGGVAVGSSSSRWWGHADVKQHLGATRSINNSQRRETPPRPLAAACWRDGFSKSALIAKEPTPAHPTPSSKSAWKPPPQTNMCPADREPTASLTRTWRRHRNVILPPFFPLCRTIPSHRIA
jgi:hypothetical protein